MNLEERGFLDAMAFWDDGRGIVLGDPVDGRFQILLTEDGGRRWTPLDPAGMPAALPHESAFAASGTCVCVAGDGRAWFGIGGGGQARVFSTVDGGRNWRASTTPIDASNESSGIFSISFDGEGRVGLAVGGDYKLAERAVRSIAKTSDGGRTWSAEGLSSPLGYRSAVTRLSKDTWLVVGPSGSDLTVDGGASWRSVDRTSFDSVSVAGSTVWVSGERGGVARRRIREIIEKHRHD
ncbi:MAG: hypothetical protein SFX72_08895 [Isosphaeraceae bacterium]|nr:hypothetical protein [Isosphaeraceae bacterium]